MEVEQEVAAAVEESHRMVEEGCRQEEELHKKGAELQDRHYCKQEQMRMKEHKKGCNRQGVGTRHLHLHSKGYCKEKLNENNSMRMNSLKERSKRLLKLLIGSLSVHRKSLQYYYL